MPGTQVSLVPAPALTAPPCGPTTPTVPPETGTRPPGGGSAGAAGDPTTTVFYPGAARDMTLGGPGATFGNDPDACAATLRPSGSCGDQPSMWAAINGPRTKFTEGDPFAVRCDAGDDDDRSGPSAGDCSAANPLYRDTGYSYAIDVAPQDVDHPLTVLAYDIGSYEQCATNGNPGTSVSAPGTTCSGYATSSIDTGTPQNFDLEVFDSGGIEGIARFDRTLPGCHLTRGADELSTGRETYRRRWIAVCTFTPPAIGVYAIRVRNSGLPLLPDVGAGTNSYSLKVTGGSGTRLYPVDDFSTYMNDGGSASIVDLAGIPDKYAGRTLVIDAFDPGDGPSSHSPFQLRVVPPEGSIGGAATAPLTCRYNRARSSTRGPATPDVAEGCRVVTQFGNQPAAYNGAWLRIEVEIPAGYACGDGSATTASPAGSSPTALNCWWRLEYDFGGGQPTDHVTWSASID